MGDIYNKLINNKSMNIAPVVFFITLFLAIKRFFLLSNDVPSMIAGQNFLKIFKALPISF